MKVTRYGVDVDLSVEGKQACPKCIKKGRDRGNDNLHVYGLDADGRHQGAFCFACNYAILSQDYQEELEADDDGDNDEEDVKTMGREFNSEVQAKLKQSTGMDPKGYREISDKVSQLYRVRYQYSEEDGSVTESLYPCTRNYGIAGYKVRSHPKDFKSPGPIGETGKNCEFFGQFAFKTHSNFCVITGGEVDAMSAYQMLNTNNDGYQDIAVVSATCGEGSTHRQAKMQYEWLNRFKRIYVCLDEDAAGYEAEEKLVQALPRGKVYIFKMRRKDPNQYLENGAGREFVQDFWASKTYTPAGIHGSSSLYEAAMGYSDLKQLSLPQFMKSAQDMFDGGLVKNELSCLFAETSVGKSIFADSMAVQWILNEPEEVVGVLSLEATAEKWATNIMSNYLGVKLIKMKGQERKDYLEQDDVKRKLKQFLEHEDGSDRFYVFDERGSGIDVVKEKIVEMIVELGVTILIVDVASDLTDGLPLNEQEALTSWFKKLIKEYAQLSILLIAHTRKRQQGSSAQLNESDIMGTSTLMKSAAQTVSLERDKQAENPFLRNCTFVRIHKNRHFSDTGPAGIVYYEPASGRLWDLEQYLEAHPEMESTADEALGRGGDDF